MINNVSLTGRIATDIRVYNGDNSNIANFNLAVQRSFTNKNGERETDFIPIVAFNKLADNISNYTQKGSLIGVEGRVQTRNYEDKDGKRVFVTEIIANNVTFLETKRNNNSEDNIDPFENEYSTKSSEVEITNDDLPF